MVGMVGPVPPLLTAAMAERLLEGVSCVSLDLGLSEVEVGTDAEDVLLPDGSRVTRGELRRIAEGGNGVFFLGDGGLFQVAISNGHFYKLVATDGAPTLEIDGIRMHRTVGVTPGRDARGKLDALGVDEGRVLDTCGGLGYTALGALGRGAGLVVSVERRSEVVRIAQLNPWSRGLFEDARAHLLIGDSFHVVEGLPVAFFDYVVHDPPRLAHAGELYGGEFYSRLFRVLRPGGLIFHYTGEPGSRYLRLDIRRGVMRRMRGAGFRDLRYVRGVLGVVGVRGP